MRECSGFVDALTNVGQFRADGEERRRSLDRWQRCVDRHLECTQGGSVRRNVEVTETPLTFPTDSQHARAEERILL